MSIYISNQSYIFNSIVDLLDESNNNFIIHGKSGVGKTWISDQIKSLLLDGDDWHTIYCPCSEGRKDDQYHPFNIAIQDAIEEGSYFKDVLRKASIEVSKDVPIVGNSLSFALDLITEAKKGKVIASDSTISGDALSILSNINRMSHRKKVLIIIDDIQWIDRNSIQLIRLMQSKSVSKSFSFLDRLSFVFILNTDVDGVDLYDTSKKLDVIESNIHYYRGCDEEEFFDFLNKTGLSPEVDNDSLSELWRIMGPHLKMARELVSLLSNKEENLLLGLGTKEDILNHAVRKKIESFGDRSDELFKLLRKASIIGSSFSFNEIACLSNSTVDEVLERLEYAEEKELIKITGRHAHFSHSVFKGYFDKYSASPSRSDHEKFQKCLAIIRPGSYGLRAFHSREAGLTDDADELALLDIISKYQSGNESLIDTDELRLKLHRESSRISLSLISRAFESFKEGSYKKCSLLCEQASFLSLTRVRSEIIILHGRSLVKSPTMEEKEKAVSILSKCIENVPMVEIDLKGRAMLYLAVAQSHLGNIEDARETVARLKSLLEPRTSYDYYSEEIINRIDLRADMFFCDDVSGVLLTDALSRIRNRQQPYSPIQEYIAATNLAGNLIYRGEFKEACILCEEADQVIKKHADMYFPRLDMLANNSLISKGLSQKINSITFSEGFKILCDHAAKTNDYYLIKSNCAAAFAIERKYYRAIGIIEDEYRELSNKDCSEFFDEYFLGNNLAGCYYQTGDIEKAKAIFSDIEKCIGFLPVSIRQFMSFRHAAYEKKLEEGEIKDWDQSLKEDLSDRIGSLSRFFGRGFIFSELQFWSDE